MKQFTKQQAIAIHDGGEWKDWTDEEIVKFQIYQNLLCVPWQVYRVAIETVLGRGVYTHEFANSKALQEEYEGLRPAPTFDEIIALLPQDKLILLEL